MDIESYKGLINNVILITIIIINIEKMRQTITVIENNKFSNEHFIFANMCS